MLRDPALTEEATDEDRELGRLLLAERAPEEIAAALVRLYRARLPGVEDIEAPSSPMPPPSYEPRAGAPARVPKGPRAMPDAVWFRMDVGRKRNADPKWLLPMLCRKGGVTRQDIGVIRIYDHETQFEVSEAVAENFLAGMRRPGGDNVRVERMGAGGGERERPKKKKFDKRAGPPQQPHEGAAPAKPKFKKKKDHKKRASAEV
ncbi:MAG: DbpA RNA binding domain-containing protein, partial [Rhodoblastus sp.]|nr:DbpA RNA binding domain-containing protein [Rhodoblastus sp.]